MWDLFFEYKNIKNPKWLDKYVWKYEYELFVDAYNLGRNSK